MYITVNSCPDNTRCKGRWCDKIKGNYILICKVHYLPSTTPGVPRRVFTDEEHPTAEVVIDD
jgi:hypothetical protein